jgi:hypothetical protein
MPVDSQYGVCFRAFLYRLMQILSVDRKHHRLHVIIEDGHKNIGGAVRIFNEMKDEYSTLGFPILGTITPVRKSECRLLMVADFQAHLGYLSETRLLKGQSDYFAMAGVQQPKANEAGLTRLEITPEALRESKTLWEEDRQRRMAEWRANRDARRAARVASAEVSE